MSYLKLTNVQSGSTGIGTGPLVLNADKIINIFQDGSVLKVMTTSSIINKYQATKTSVKTITFTGDTGANLIKEINDTLTGNPGGKVLELFTKAQITGFNIYN